MSTELLEPPVQEAPEAPPLPSDEREEALGNLCDHVKNLLATNDSSELDALHAVGTSLLDASGQAIYGPQVTKEVAARLNTYRQKIQFSSRFATAYDTAGFDDLKSMTTEVGDPYVWSVTHVRFLLRVRNESERHALAAECARANWGCRKLEDEVKACMGETEAPPNANADISSILKDFLRVYKDWNGFMSQMAAVSTNLKDRIQGSNRSLTEKQKSMLRTAMEQFPAFTENVCEANGYLSQIVVP
jgi:hypothetical protein